MKYVRGTAAPGHHAARIYEDTVIRRWCNACLEKVRRADGAPRSLLCDRWSAEDSESATGAPWGTPD